MNTERGDTMSPQNFGISYNAKNPNLSEIGESAIDAEPTQIHIEDLVQSTEYPSNIINQLFPY